MLEISSAILKSKWIIDFFVFLTVWLFFVLFISAYTRFAYVTFRQGVAKQLSWSTREKISIRLKRSGLYNWEAVDWVLLREGLTTIAAGVLYVSSQQWLMVLMGVVVIRVWLYTFINTKIKNQLHQLSHDLPYFIDLLCMTLTSGMNLQTGIQTSLQHIQPGALRLAWQQYVFDIRSGVAYDVAMQNIMANTGHNEMRRVCVALIQAQQRGMSVAGILSEHARQLRASHLLAAEKKALQAPVRMLFPLVVCFFPCTFLVLGFAIWVSAGFGA
jgi:tight adherence protein C